MLSNQIIETTGYIIKTERLKSLEENIMPNTLVLKSMKPFPGYEDKSGIKTKPRLNYVYLILMYRYFPEKIERISRVLKNEKYNKCNFSCSEIVIQNKILPCIRIKGLECYEIIPDIQEDYKHNDIKFMSFKAIDSEGKIKVYKHFKISEITEGIYRDLFEGAKFYFTIPKQINWKILENTTYIVKKKIENSNFDSALGIINRFNGPEDVIRIFDKNKTLERALEIRNKYIKELKREHSLTNTFKKAITSTFNN
jgi:hypothetical protein